VAVWDCAYTVHKHSCSGVAADSRDDPELLRLFEADRNRLVGLPQTEQDQLAWPTEGSLAVRSTKERTQLSHPVT
jgi:hypothetical protein